ncbi:MAG: murein L,D-transpeptidase catalytic domain family protein [Gemmatimonadota bacterium]|nr:murein L,D-transpeptidase catalytic domain family protein [Gemmatimonadota bacterium]MDH3422693.1 murein L,D-transpeptidase catalytic domain family protein [Gemmatimonadota bacterium]
MRGPRLAHFAALGLLFALPPVGVGGGPVHAEPTAVPTAGTPEDDADRAVAALAGLVEPLSHPEALRVAADAYYAYREAHPNKVRKPLLYFVDLGLDNRTARGWVFDMDRLTVVEGPFTVAHGRGSATVRDGIPTRFSNVSGSKASSVGLYLAEGTYTFRGSAGGRAYSSLGLRLRGESGAFNSAAIARGIVVHGAPYVTPTSAGRSEGCPAMELDRAERLLPALANGGVVFLYSPLAEEWLSEGPWVAQRPTVALVD